MHFFLLIIVLVDPAKCMPLTMDPGVCWLIVDDLTLHWNAAARYCIERSGTLAIERTKAIGDKIRGPLANYDNRRRLWMGIRRRIGEQDYKWINGKLDDYVRLPALATLYH